MANSMLSTSAAAAAVVGDKAPLLSLPFEASMARASPKERRLVGQGSSDWLDWDGGKLGYRRRVGSEREKKKHKEIECRSE